MTISKTIRTRLAQSKTPFMANDSIAEHITDKERAALQEEIQGKVQSLLESLVIDTKNDPNAKDTARRVAKMYVQEVMKGRYHKVPDVTIFPNTKKLNELIIVGPIAVRSMCSHHMVPIFGKCWIGVLPGDKLFGLSKFERICEWFLARPQIQEEAIVQIADYIAENLSPMGHMVVMEASHMCMSWRGVKNEEAVMTTSVVRGVMAANPFAKQEFLSLIKKG